MVLWCFVVGLCVALAPQVSGFHHAWIMSTPHVKGISSLGAVTLEGIPDKAISEIEEPAAQFIIENIQSADVVVPESISLSPISTTYIKLAAAASTQRKPTKTAIFDFDFFSNAKAKKATTKKAPILLLHGFDSSCLEFRRIAPLLAEGDRDVYVLDILGWGFSDTQDIASAKPEAKLEHIKCFIEQVIGGPCVLLGASLGGAIAIILSAETCPNLVERLILIGTLHILYTLYTLY